MLSLLFSLLPCESRCKPSSQPGSIPGKAGKPHRCEKYDPRSLDRQPYLHKTLIAKSSSLMDDGLVLSSQSPGFFWGQARCDVSRLFISSAYVRGKVSGGGGEREERERREEGKDYGIVGREGSEGGRRALMIMGSGLAGWLAGRC